MPAVSRPPEPPSSTCGGMPSEVLPALPRMRDRTDRKNRPSGSMRAAATTGWGSRSVTSTISGREESGLQGGGALLSWTGFSAAQAAGSRSAVNKRYRVQRIMRALSVPARRRRRKASRYPADRSSRPSLAPEARLQQGPWIPYDAVPWTPSATSAPSSIAAPSPPAGGDRRGQRRSRRRAGRPGGAEMRAGRRPGRDPPPLRRRPTAGPSARPAS